VSCGLFAVVELLVFCAVFTLGNNAYGQCGRKIIDNEEHRSVNFIFHLFDIFSVLLNHFAEVMV